MAKEELKIGEISKPRFEFRSFGQCFCEAHKRMARLSVPVPEKVWERESDEIYIISRKNDINNTKIRNGKMESCYFSGSVATTSGHFVHKSERRTRDGGFHIRPVCC